MSLHLLPSDSIFIDPHFERFLWAFLRPLRRECDVLIPLKKVPPVDRTRPCSSEGNRVQRHPYRIVLFLVAVNYHVVELA